MSTSARLTKYVVGPVDCPLVKALKRSVVTRKIIRLSSTMRAIVCLQSVLRKMVKENIKLAKKLKFYLNISSDSGQRSEPPG